MTMPRAKLNDWVLPTPQSWEVHDLYSDEDFDKILDLIGGTARANSEEVKTTIRNIAGTLNFSLHLASRPTDPEKTARLHPIQTRLAELNVLLDQLDPDTVATLRRIAGREPINPRTEPKAVDRLTLSRRALDRLRFDRFGRERAHDPEVAAPLEAVIGAPSEDQRETNIGPHGPARYREAIEWLVRLRTWTDTALNELPAGKKGRRRLDPARDTAKALLDMKRHYNRTRGGRVTERGLLDLLTAVALPVFARYAQTPKLEAVVKEILPTYKPSKAASSD